MFDVEKFLSHEKSMLIAPAGYGKTHTIAASMNIIKNEGCHLVLTHTHAGIASIKEKLKKENIPSKSFHVETIQGLHSDMFCLFTLGMIFPFKQRKAIFHSF